MDRMDLSLGIQLHEDFTRPMGKAINISEKFHGQMTAQQKLLRDIGRDRSAIRKYQDLSASLDKTAGKKSELIRKAGLLGKEIKALEKDNKRVPATLKKQYEAAVAGIGRANNKHIQQKDILRSLRNQLRGSGYDTRNLAEETKRLGDKYATTQKNMRAMAAETERSRQIQRKFDASLQKAAHISLVADGMQRTGDAAMRLIEAPTQEMRGVERAKGDLQALGIQDTEATIKRGQALEREFAYMDTASFTAAAYNIKSGIEGLSDVGVADVTEDAAVTAKATKAQVETMTELFGTGFGTFKNTEFADKTNAEFSEIFGATLAATVQKFKTTGTKMQQGIESMGAGLAISGVDMSEQMAALGMLQKNMTAGTAGTTLSALERSAAQAQERFAKMGAGIEIIGDDGNMRGLADLLEAMQTEFGANFSTETGFQIQEAFGSEEAVKFFKHLWGQQEQLRANNNEIKAAAEAGEKYTRSMAAATDLNNADARLKLSEQRIQVAQQKIGRAMIPMWEALAAVVDPISSWVEDVMDNGSLLPKILIGTVAGVGLLATGLAPVVTGLASLTITVAWLKKSMVQLGIANKRQALSGAMGGGGGSGLGFLGRRGKALSGLMRNGRRFLGKGGLIGAGLGALSIGSTLMDDTLSGKDKVKAISSDGGSILGGMGGAALGAAIGTAIFPGVGTVVGGLLGGWLGSDGGAALGEGVGNWLTEDKQSGSDGITRKTKAAATAIMMTPAITGAAAADYTPVQAPDYQAGTRIEDNSQNHYQLTINPNGGDPEEIGRIVVEHIARNDRKRARDKANERRSALYDN